MNYKSAVEVCQTTFRESLEEKINLLMAMQNLQLLETNFIGEALNTIIEAKRTLKNTYIFGYYMKDNEKKQYFEHEQGILQYWTEELHRYLIDDQLSMVIMEDNYISFAEKLKNYKNSVNNIIESIGKYSKGLIDDIENNFISEIDYKLLDE